MMSRNMDSMGAFTDGFIGALLDDYNGDGFEESGDTHVHKGRGDISPDTLAEIIAECRAFYEANETHIFTEGACLRDCSQWGVATMAGHDLYMTRRGHGVGFWDSTCWKEGPGQIMDTYAESMGHFEGLYLGDDGVLYT